jgi:hypothetical protein
MESVAVFASLLLQEQGTYNVKQNVLCIFTIKALYILFMTLWMEEIASRYGEWLQM